MDALVVASWERTRDKKAEGAGGSGYLKRGKLDATLHPKKGTAPGGIVRNLWELEGGVRHIPDPKTCEAVLSIQPLTRYELIFVLERQTFGATLSASYILKKRDT